MRSHRVTLAAQQWTPFWFTSSSWPSSCSRSASWSAWRAWVLSCTLSDCTGWLTEPFLATFCLIYLGHTHTWFTLFSFIFLRFDGFVAKFFLPIHLAKILLISVLVWLRLLMRILLYYLLFDSFIKLDIVSGLSSRRSSTAARVTRSYRSRSMPFWPMLAMRRYRSFTLKES